MLPDRWCRPGGGAGDCSCLQYETELSEVNTEHQHTVALCSEGVVEVLEVLEIVEVLVDGKSIVNDVPDNGRCGGELW